MEVSTALRKKLGSEVAVFFNEKRGLFIARLELPPDASGDRRRRQVTARTEDKLVEKVRPLVRQYRISGNLVTASPSVTAWLEAWLDGVARKRIRPTTLRGYRSVVRRQIIPSIGNIRLERLTPAHIRKMHDFVIDSGLTSTYALNAHRVLAKALEDAVREGKLDRNPAKMLDAPKKARTSLHVLDVTEAKAVVRGALEALTADVYDPEPVRDAIYLLTGARRGEIIGLEWDRLGSAVDLSWQLQRVADIAQAPADYEYRPIANGLYWVRPKTTAGYRIIPMFDQLAVILAEHRLRAGSNEWGLVFVDENGRPIDPDKETKRWARARAKYTTKHVRLHDLRHTTVDLLYEADVPEDIIMEIVGHSVRMVTRGYKSKQNEARLRRGMESFAALFDVPPAIEGGAR